MIKANKAPTPAGGNKTDMLDEILTVDEVAAMLRLNRKTVYEQVQLGKIPGCRKIGRSIRFSRQAVLDWLNG